MEIDTKIENVFIEIEGRRYAVKERTAGVIRALRDADERAKAEKMMPWEFELKQLEILLGEDAVKELFPRGDDENVTRIDRIYAGALEAFNYNETVLRDARMQAYSKASEQIKPFVELMQLMGKIDDGKTKIIHRK